MRFTKILQYASYLTFVLSISVGAQAQTTSNEVPVFITIGQSNADGSAFFNSTIDEEMRAWYTSSANTKRMKMWYRSTEVQNQEYNSTMGESARWVFDGTVTDVEPGWLDLWYRNENTEGRTAMNMIHSYGSYSTGTGTDCAQGRRGMEGNFGRVFATAYPDTDLYFIKLGVSGSFISAWANPQDDHNWDYFYENVFKPAMTDLINKGKRPVIAGVWWMQGCGDAGKTQTYYQTCLIRLVERINNNLGFPGAKVYIGYIPTKSAGYGQGVRNAQKEVTTFFGQCEAVETENLSMQYESNLGGYVHFDHAGVNAIGEDLANRVVTAGSESWLPYSTPGKWAKQGGNIVFVPDFGEPVITYATSDNVVTATLTYPGFVETKTYRFSSVGSNPADGEVITLQQPEGATIVVYNDGVALTSGTKIVAGTVLTLGVTTQDNYKLKSITVNGQPIESNTFTVEGATTISADLDFTPEYVEPSGDSGSQANCYVETASTSGAKQNINISRTGKRSSNWELCDEQTIEVEQGSTFTLRLQAKVTNTSTSSVPDPQDLRYCVAYLFTDWDGDCTFEPVEITSGTFAGKSFYGYFKDDTGFGGNIKANYDYVMDINHEFTVPVDAALGETRIRVIYTEAWDSNAISAENKQISGNYQKINKGYAYDYLVKVQEDPISGIGGVSAGHNNGNAPYTIYNLQGVSLGAENPQPGIYLVRQGAAVKKVLVK